MVKLGAVSGTRKGKVRLIRINYPNNIPSIKQCKLEHCMIK